MIGNIVMSSPSVSYSELVLSHLEKVLRLPREVQSHIAKRVKTYIDIAKAAKNEAILETLTSRATEEQAKAIGRGMMDPQWAAPAIAEAWCYAKMSLSNGYLDRPHAEAIIGAIEAFTSSRVSD